MHNKTKPRDICDRSRLTPHLLIFNRYPVRNIYPLHTTKLRHLRKKYNRSIYSNRQKILKCQFREMSKSFWMNTQMSLTTLPPERTWNFTRIISVVGRIIGRLRRYTKGACLLFCFENVPSFHDLLISCVHRADGLDNMTS